MQALILAPTRELAQQIQKVVMALGDYMGAQCHACIGGTSVREDMRKLDDGVHVVVGKFQLLSWFTSCLTVIVNAKLAV